MKKKFQIFVLNLSLLFICILLVAFHYSKKEERKITLNEAINQNLIRLNFITSEGTDCIETIVLNNTSSHLKIKIPKGTLLKIVSKRFLFMKVLTSDIIDIFPHSTVEQFLFGKCFQSIKNSKTK